MGKDHQLSLSSFQNKKLWWIMTVAVDLPDLMRKVNCLVKFAGHHSDYRDVFLVYTERSQKRGDQFNLRIPWFRPTDVAHQESSQFYRDLLRSSFQDQFDVAIEELPTHWQVTISTPSNPLRSTSSSGSSSSSYHYPCSTPRF